MKIQNIHKTILTASICAAIMTSCGSEKSSETSSDKDSGAVSVSDLTDVNMEDFDIEIPENAVYCQTELVRIKGEPSTIAFNFYDDHDNCIYLYSHPVGDSENEFQTTFYCSYSYKYNDDGTISEMNMAMQDSSPILSEFEYSDDKKLETERTYRNDEMWSTAFSELDEHSNPVRCEIAYVDNDKLNSVTTYEYEYDSEGRILVEKCFSDKSSNNTTKYYTYDANGNMTSLETQYADMDLTMLTKYTYNSDNRLIRQEEFTDGEESSYAEYEYEFYN
ncbi:MAG: hypothetical protein IJ010_03270 [Ruminococcus sp.]|nr:hypothetical protein [Ruminococcus sp.]